MCPYHESPYFSINAHAVSSDRVPAETLWSTAVKIMLFFLLYIVLGMKETLFWSLLLCTK